MKDVSFFGETNTVLQMETFGTQPTTLVQM